MSYISREEAIKAITDNPARFAFITSQQITALKKLPTADVVEVVRCKDCLFAKKGFDECDIYCKLNDVSFGKDAYCSYGERREE